MLKVTELAMADVKAGDTRQVLGEKLDLPTREQFAAEWKLNKGNPYQTKYWPLEMVLQACDRWDIKPTLTQTGKDRVRRAGGLSYGNGARSTVPPKQNGNGSTPPQAKQEENRRRLEALKAKKSPPPPAPTPDEEEVVADATLQEDHTEVERRRAALVALIDDRITQSRSGADEDTRTLIASVASASAGAAVMTALDEGGRRILADAEKQVREMIEQARPIVHHFQFGDLPPVVIDGPVHEVMDEVLQLAKARANIALIGPTGSGKTHICRQVAEALGFDVATQYAAQSCSGGMSESKIIGGLLPTGEGGKFEPFYTDFIRLFENGGVFLGDEWDAADENVALVVNSALANGYMDVMGLGRIKRHPDFIMIVAMNTFGTGANRMYVGRNQLDEATLDRFRIGQVEMDYDREMERGIVKGLGGKESWLQRCWKIREAINRQKLRRNMSTRFILDGVRMQVVAGWDEDHCLRKFTMGWSQDEREKVGL